MAACEVSCDSFESRQPKALSSACLSKAVDLFVMTKFEKCLQVCTDVINAAKCEPEQERNNEVIEAAAALGIQAMAEMDQWHHTVSFITEVYGDVHLCTARIVQVCILLHAHVEEYLPCHKLVNTWLRHPDNLNSKHCAQVIRLYGEHVLLPLGQFVVLEEIVNSCLSLSDKERAALLELPQSGRFKDAKSITSQREVISPQHFFNSEEEEKENKNIELSEVKDWSCSNESDSLPSSESRKKSVSTQQGPLALLAICKKLYCSVLGYMRSRWREKFVLLVMGVFALWAVAHTQTGDPVSSLGHLVTLWQGFLHRLRLIF